MSGLHVDLNVEGLLRSVLAVKLPEDMNIPGLRFHGLKGKDKGRYAVDASGNGGSHLVGMAMMP
jgi:hypothetical protein